MKFDKNKEAYIVENYKAGMSTVEIAKRINSYNTSIRRVLQRNNITLRTLHEVQSRVKASPLKLGDEYSEYFLGLMLTDGCICHRKNSLSATVSLSLKDREMVEKFRDFICPQNKVSKVFHKKYNTYTFQFSTRSNLIANWFENYGNFHNKSYECDIYTQITPHILRGIFDGDGYLLNKNKGTTLVWGVCGKSLVFLEKIQKYLYTLDIKSYIRKVHRANNTYLYYMEVFKTVDVLKIISLMYKEAHIYLKRKYVKGHLFVETLKEKFAKFRESDASANPEPSHNKCKVRDKKTGRFIMEGAEIIMRYLNTDLSTW